MKKKKYESGHFIRIMPETGKAFSMLCKELGVFQLRAADAIIQNFLELDKIYQKNIIMK